MRSISDELARAIRLHECGRLDEAKQIYEQILSAEPNHAASLHHFGVVAFQQGNREAAEAYIARALEVRPDYAEAYCNLGLVLRSQGKRKESITCQRKALELKPDFAEAHFNLGTVLLDDGKSDEAAAMFRRALELKPDYARAFVGLGLALAQQGNWEEAISCYERGLELEPGHAEGHNNLGTALKAQGKIDEAVASYRRALAHKPDFAEAEYNLGLSLQDGGLLEEAIACYRKALQLKADYVDALSNLGTAYQEQGDYDAASACYRRTIELDPNMAGGHSNQATLMLLTGDFDNGWLQYEWRWKTGQLRVREFPKPRWEGEPLEGKTILLWAEQGLGDTIQFIRYAALVKNLGATVFLQSQQPLVKILVTFPGVDRLFAAGDELPEFDFHSPLLSLPRIFNTTLDTIPANVPYLFDDPALVAVWRQRLANLVGNRVSEPATQHSHTHHSLRIGINWHGRAGRGTYRLRDIPLDCFASLAQLPAVQLVSLQKGPGREELESSRDQVPIIDLGDNVDEAHGPFMDTAAIMKNLDLVITSDTAIPHLAGALGVPAWLALPFVPDWRWLLNRSDSPWYPSMRLFRQKTPGDWASVFAEMQVALAEIASAS